MVNRAVISSVMAVLGAFGACASSLVLSRIVSMCFLLVVLGVAISAIRTFLHPDAQIAGGIRWIGLALSGVASFVAVAGLIVFAAGLIRG